MKKQTTAAKSHGNATLDAKASKPTGTSGGNPKHTPKATKTQFHRSPEFAEALVKENLLSFRRTATLHEWETIFHQLEQEYKGEMPEELEEREKADQMTQCLEHLAEDAPDQRNPYTNIEVMEAITEQYKKAFETALAEMIRFYCYVHPREHKVIYQLAEIAGHIHHSAEMLIFKEQQSQRQNQ